MSVLGEHLTDDQAMNLAMLEAEKGAGFVSPNPMVGCVILDSHGRFLSKGYHKIFGGPHAEINALEGLSLEQLESARVFVTLEPCAHEGKTPSCAKALARLPLKEVIYGLVDPNPLVAGSGANIISEAGIKTTLYNKNHENLEEVCEHFLMNFRSQRPFVSVKIASSLDGQLGLKTGESKWITGEVSRQKSRYLRAIHDVTVVGKNTLLMDDPQLNIRHDNFPEKENKILILDSTGECLKFPGLRIFETHRPENIFVAVSDSMNHAEGPAENKTERDSSSLAQVLKVQRHPQGGLNLNELLRKLWKLGVKSVFVEGGAQAVSSFIEQKEAHRLYLFQAPILLGANSGKPWSEGVSIKKMSDRISLKNPKIQRLESDLLITGRLF